MPSNLYYPNKVKPQEVHLKVGKNKISVYKIRIGKVDYEVCSECDLWCSTKKGQWGRGLINTDDDKFKAERTGLLGEVAFAKVFGFPVDVGYVKGGKDIDFLSCNKKSKIKIEVKTASKLTEYKAGLIRCYKEPKLKADIYVFCYVDEDDPINKIASVVLVGFEYAHNILKQKKKRARMGMHQNYELSYGSLLPIRCLGEII